MSDDLRTRIANVIYYEDGHSDRAWAERTADAVIAELDKAIPCKASSKEDPW